MSDELTTNDLRNIDDFIDSLGIASQHTGVRLADRVPLWIDGEIVGYAYSAEEANIGYLFVGVEQ
jgi:hypothetical protein